VRSGYPRGIAVVLRDVWRSKWGVVIGGPASVDQSAGSSHGERLELYRAFGPVEHDCPDKPGLTPAPQDGEGAAQFRVFHLESAPPQEETPTGQRAVEPEGGEQQLTPFIGRQTRQ